MKVAIAKERRAHERRVAASPDTVKRLVGMGLEVVVESGAGAGAAFPDAAYAAAGATIARDAAAALGDADIVLKVQRPLTAARAASTSSALMKRGAVLVGMLQPLQHPDDVAGLCRGRASPPSRWSWCRASPARRRWTCCRRRPISPAISAVLDAAARVRPRLSDDDDGGRHDRAGARPGHGRRRRRAAGDRHGAPARRDRLRDRCAARRQGAGREPRRHLPHRRHRGDEGRPRRPAATPRRWARISSAASASMSPRR